MHERHLPFITKRNIFFCSTLILCLGLGKSIEQFGKNFSKQFAEHPDCSEYSPKSNRYDAIAVFGAGTAINEYSEAEPNLIQKARLAAAAQAYVLGYSSKIILLDGGNPQVFNQSKIFLQNYVYFLSGGSQNLHDDHIVNITNSINTAENVQDLKYYSQQNKIRSILSITSFFHADRVRILQDNSGFTQDVDPLECLINQDELGLGTNLNLMNKFNLFIKEQVALAELNIDPTGKLSTIRKEWIMSHSR